MQIDIVGDTICPWCYVGKKRLDRALAARPQEAVVQTWQPFQLNPEMPEGGMDRGDYLRAKFGSYERAARQYERLSEAGREEGIDFRFERISVTPNTIDSHRLVRLAENYGSGTKLVDALFAAYFSHGRDIGNIAELTEIGVECGLDRALVADFLSSDEDRDVVSEQDEKTRQIGVSGVPCFVIEGQYAVSGAQAPEIFHQIFDLVRQDKAEEAVS